MYFEARDLERRGDAAGALAIYEALCGEYPLRLGFHLRRIALARRTLGPAEAAGLYEPPPPGVGEARAGILATLARLPSGDLPGRRQALEFATAQEPREALWRLAMADLELSGYEVVVARARHERALAMVESAERSFAEAAEVLERGRQEAETAIQLDPGLAEGHLFLGYIARELAGLATQPERRDDWRKVAGGHYRRALELDPDSPVARVDYAENLLYFDDYDDAVRELKRAAELLPGDIRVWTNLGLAYWRTGRTSDAEAAYRKGLAIEPRNARLRAALADCRRKEGDPEEAIEELARARADAQADPAMLAEIAFQTATVHESRGDFAKAIEEYQRHIALGGGDAAKARSRIRRLYESSAARTRS